MADTIDTAMKSGARINIESSLVVTLVASLGFLLVLGLAPVRNSGQDGFATQPYLPELIRDRFTWEPSSEQIRDLPERTKEPGPSSV
ncbi:hypothetical protein ACE5IS_11910 [Leptospira wolffii]|uniref:Uncharacterized protein n=1 Tax=Leptospira wolffii TaxID=409998 RepID=A0ABV5BNV1_9LEPT